MNYYDELFEKLDNLILKKEYDEAIYKLKEELNMPYIPKDIEYRLNEYYDEINYLNEKPNKELSDDDLIALLKKDQNCQIIAVSKLVKRNLRELLPEINEYLCSDGLINCKVVIIDELIKQEINEEVSMKDNGIEYSFIPKYLISPEESDGFLEAKRILEDYYLKDPSKLKMAIELLYKRTLLSLPINLVSEEGQNMAQEIYEYIEEAFNSSGDNKVLN